MCDSFFKAFFRTDNNILKDKNKTKKKRGRHKMKKRRLSATRWHFRQIQDAVYMYICLASVPLLLQCH